MAKFFNHLAFQYCTVQNVRMYVKLENCGYDVKWLSLRFAAFLRMYVRTCKKYRNFMTYKHVVFASDSLCTVVDYIGQSCVDLVYHIRITGGYLAFFF
jgi:hypothetical protein